MTDAERKEFLTLFRTVTNDETALSGPEWEFINDRLYQFSKPDFRFFVEISPGYDIPGFCGLRIHYFNDAWRFVRKDAFATGYRQRIVQLKQIHSKVLDADVLVLKTASNGPFQVNDQGERIGTPFFSGKATSSSITMPTGPFLKSGCTIRQVRPRNWLNCCVQVQQRNASLCSSG